MNKIINFLFTAPLLVFVLVGCGQGRDESPTLNEGEGNATSSDNSQFVEYGVAGDIVEITTIEEEEMSGSILVEGSEDSGATYTEAVVTITPDTKIYLNDLTEFENLEVGMYVNVFFEGGAEESFPVQATAKQINVIPDDTK